MLFSATQTEKIEDLISLSFRTRPLFINVDRDAAVATADRIQQVLICLHFFYVCLLAGFQNIL